MDLRQLRALIAVADHGSFSSAARSLHTVQSNVSAHIARLEAELDVLLIDRATTTLTEDGEVVAKRARRIESELGAMTSDIASLRDEIRGKVRLGVIGSTARWFVPSFLDAMAERYPDVELVIMDAPTSSLVPQLVSGRIDLALVNTPLNEPDVQVAPLFDEDRVLVAPADHPLYERESVQLTDLAEHELLLEARGTAFRDALDFDARRAGVRLRAKAEVDGIRLLASLAFSGFGAAVLPASAAPLWVGGEWKRIPIEGLSMRSVGLARRRRGLPSAAERAVAETARAVVEDNAPDQPGIHPVAGR